MENTQKKSFLSLFLDGIFFKNPVLSLFLGLTLAVLATETVQGALILSVITAITFLLTSLLVSVLRKNLSKFACFAFSALVSAALSTALSLFASALFPAAFDSLALASVVPFIATTSFIVLKSEEALSRPLGETMADALGSALGFVLVLLVISFFRETLATGAIKFVSANGDSHIWTLWDKSKFRIRFMQEAFGGLFFTALFSGLHLTIVHLIESHKASKEAC